MTSLANFDEVPLIWFAKLVWFLVISSLNVNLFKHFFYLSKFIFHLSQMIIQVKSRSLQEHLSCSYLKQIFKKRIQARTQTTHTTSPLPSLDIDHIAWRKKSMHGSFWAWVQPMREGVTKWHLLSLAEPIYRMIPAMINSLSPGDATWHLRIWSTIMVLVLIT